MRCLAEVSYLRHVSDAVEAKAAAKSSCHIRPGMVEEERVALCCGLQERVWFGRASTVAVFRLHIIISTMYCGRNSNMF